MAIIVGETQTTRDSVELLKEFGSRVWTLPEVLLAPQKDNLFRIYGRNGDMTLSRYQILRDIWADADTSRQLVEHYQGNLILSRLELSTIALRTLYLRKHGPMYDGDHVYALMGLLRQRIEADASHTSFEAFASLSLMADSDQLLERLICMQPKSRNQPWHEMTDWYGAQLWDIKPSCQISGIGLGRSDGQEHVSAEQLRNTVIVDGLRGASVRWKGFARVACVHRVSWVRAVVKVIMAVSSYFSLIGLLLIIRGALLLATPPPSYVFLGHRVEEPNVNAARGMQLLAPGIFFSVLGFMGVLFRPEFLMTEYSGKKWQNQPWLFGIEGHCDIGEIESKLFGTNEGHLKWAPFGSPLSRHQPNESGDVKGVDPMTRPDVQAEVRRIHAEGKTRVFMLVDTFTMTVTLFEAARPPVAFLLAGGEGGMQRAIGVSLDWVSNTVYRETVLRMDSRALDTMQRVSRVRMGLSRDD
jgi:hypothetical protein